jgi:hypothetical protein
MWTSDTPIVAPLSAVRKRSDLATSEFWRSLASEFRSVHSRVELAFHWAEWNLPGAGLPHGWILADHYPFKIEFTALALRAGQALEQDAPSLLSAWLDALKRYNPPSLKMVDKSRDIGVIDADGKDIRWVAGELHNLCYASADFCKALEIGAILSESKAPSTSPQEPLPITDQPHSETRSREERLQAFVSGNDTSIAPVCRAAVIYKPQMQEWRHNLLDDTSIMSKRIEDVLSGNTPVEVRGKNCSLTPRIPR